MPIFDYQCSDCGKTYDVFHKVREIVEEIICPQCGSTKYKKLMSAPMVAVGSASGSTSSSMNESAGSCCCGGGACGID
ncbi:MAG TPA: zinc ribbon domain-containing protein [Bacteroidota bacterium]|nr:zinc ribbon domain-containing protein [Bacteroidota bacterium]